VIVLLFSLAINRNPVFFANTVPVLSKRRTASKVMAAKGRVFLYMGFWIPRREADCRQ